MARSATPPYVVPSQHSADIVDVTVSQQTEMYYDITDRKFVPLSVQQMVNLTQNACFQRPARWYWAYDNMPTYQVGYPK